MDLLAQLNVGGLLFGALATLTVVSALGVALSRNVLYSGFALMGSLVGVAGLYLFIGADFLGIAQMLIYVGGILVLLLFAVLLTNKIGAVNISNSSVNMLAGVVGSLGLFLILAKVTLETKWPKIETAVAPTTSRLGDAFLREYLLPFELASVILLMALVGAMVIARRAAKETPRTDDEIAAVERLE
jgi:NAD(P)H-quinone oxidoreductase subunit 6